MPIYKRAYNGWAKMAIAGLFLIATTDAITIRAKIGDKKRQLRPTSHLLNMKRNVAAVDNDEPINFNWVSNTDATSPIVSLSGSNKEKDTVHHFFSTPPDTMQHIISTSITHPTPSSSSNFVPSKKKTNYPTRAGDEMDFSDYIAAQQGGKSFDPCSGDSRRSRSGRGLRSSSRRSQGCGTASPGPTVSVVPTTSTLPSSQVRRSIYLSLFMMRFLYYLHTHAYGIRFFNMTAVSICSTF